MLGLLLTVYLPILSILGIEIAEKALKHANGYSLRNKPIVIAFGHQK